MLRFHPPSIMILACLATGCTATYPPPTEPLALPRVEPVDATVILRLPEELTSHTWEYSHMMDALYNSRTRIFLGGVLGENATRVAKAAFTTVTVNGSSHMQAPDRFVLTPRLESIDQPAGVDDKWDQTITIVLEWRLTDPSGELAWVETVSGQGTEYYGTAFQRKGRTTKRLHQALQDVFATSLTTIVAGVRPLEAKLEAVADR